MRVRSIALVACLTLSPRIAVAQAHAQAPARGASVLAVLDTLPESPTFKQIQLRTYYFKEAGRPMNYELFSPGIRTT